MKLILYRGIPGSGKSSAAQRMFPGVLRVENDMFHMRDGKYMWDKQNMPAAVSWCADTVETALKNKFDVCVANTFTKQKYVQFYKDMADRYGAEFIVYRCCGNFKNIHGLSKDVMDSFSRSFEDWPGEILIN